MKEVVKYIMIFVLVGLAYFHLSSDNGSEVSNFMRAFYFNLEYISIASILIYLATLCKGKERLFFGVLSGYFSLKIVYNTLLYITPIGIKLGLNNSEFWGFVFTGIIIICLIIIQYRYVKER